MLYPVVLAVLARDILRLGDRGTDLPSAPSEPTLPANDAAYRLRLVPAGDPWRSNTKPLARPDVPVPPSAPILYEEYHPHGMSAYRAVSSGIEVSAKRYRYTGKERDKETGLDHMGRGTPGAVRRYAPDVRRFASSSIAWVVACGGATSPAADETTSGPATSDDDPAMVSEGGAATGVGTDTSGGADSTTGAPPVSIDVQGHRGNRGNVPPGNTLPSFESALALGVHTLEGDLQITADGDVVFGHDSDLAITGCAWTGEDPAPPTQVGALTLDQIALFDCHPELVGIQSPPPLAAVLDLDPVVAFNLELKTLDEVAADVYVSAMVDYDVACAGCLSGRLTIQSFSWASIEHARAAYGDQLDFRGSLLALGAPSDADLEAAATYAQIFSPTFEVVDATLVARLHDAGLEILPWTANDVDDLQALVDLGVDGIITDVPDVLLDLLGRGAG